MRMAFFSVPAHGASAEADDLNAFLAGHRIRDVRRRFVDAGLQSYWAICVVYLNAEAQDGGRTAAPVAASRRRIDYREILPPKEFAAFASMRSLRKQLAERDGVPVYQVASNEQLAEMVRGRMRSRDDLASVQGFGPARLQKYGDALLAGLVDAAAGDEQAGVKPGESAGSI